MKIIVARHLGLCFGVRDAIAHAQTIADHRPLTILGELVHNPVVREQLRGRGIEEGSLDDPQPRTRTIMITAHGASDKQREKWSAAGYHVADATCPLVRHAHEQLKRLVADGFFPVVIGKRGHVEVRGLTEDFPECFVLEEAGQVCDLPYAKRYGIISQTTQPSDRVRDLLNTVARRYPHAELRFVDTVCRPTKDRQTALQMLIAEADCIVVVGGRNSNNTRQLVQACRKAGRHTIHIERPEEIRPTDFIGAAVVGLTAGTSTLPETIEAVRQRLEQISSDKILNREPINPRYP
jgi:4-hydroxy-3-methylbut-2-enyl diphosphate reductase